MSNTSTFIRSHRPNNKPLKGCKVFVTVKSPIETAINDWFDRNKIHMLRFKSRAWDLLVKARNKLVAEQIRQALKLNEDATVNFSNKCGCGCGCSPGFNVKGSSLSAEYWSCNVWIDVNDMPTDSNESVSKLIAAADSKLKQEKVEHAVT